MKRTVLNMTKVFIALEENQLINLRYHLKEKTPICCGKLASKFADGSGGG